MAKQETRVKDLETDLNMHSDKMTNLEGDVVNKGSVLVSDGSQPGHSLPDVENDIEEDALRRVHREKDFISLLSCTPDAVAYRSRENGSLLIQHVVSVFTEFAKQDDIDNLFRKVMQRFDDPAPSVFQMPTKDRTTLLRRFYLFPDI
ncbi:caspase-1-like [Thalassophryne amazonica]|uniref:caspase-1-like n=1 Tax=Thalassophryne amazonica TaxID=390379 RepID=UPI001470941D|nr:caspase-1-like [Thalassophryne amazonica]